jgi:P4 family phage/plasmid primase-like protien
MSDVATEQCSTITARRLDDALEAVRMGLSIQPVHYITKSGVCSCGGGCTSPGKHVISANGKALEAVCDEAETLRRWTQYPDANIAFGVGVPLFGKDGQPIVVVLDVDIPEGHPGSVDGFEGLRRLQKDSVGLPTTKSYNSGGGGLGIILLTNRTDLRTGGKNKYGVALRATKGNYALLPHSTHKSGGRYEWRTKDAPFGFLPDVMADKLRPTQGEGIQKLPECATPNMRHDTFVSFIGTMFNRGFSEEAALEAVLAYNAKQCKPSKSEKEIRDTVADCYGRFSRPASRQLTRGDKLIKSLALKDEKFEFLYNKQDVGEYGTEEKAVYALCEKLAYWCNGDSSRMLRLAQVAPRLKDNFDAEFESISKHIAIARNGLVEGFEDADCIEFLTLGSRGLVVSYDRVARDILNNYAVLVIKGQRNKFYIFDETPDERTVRLSGGKQKRPHIYKENGYELLHTEIRNRLKHRSSTKAVVEVLDIIRAESYRDRDDTEAPLNLIPLRNGVFNTDDKTIGNYTPEIPFFISHSGGYDKSLLTTQSEARKCLESTFFNASDDEIADINVFQQVAGTCFYRKYIDQKAVMLVGKSDSGRSMILKLLKDSVGSVSARTLQELSGDRFAAASLHWMTANVAADIGSGEIKQVGRFNTLTGDDLTTCERKGVDGFPFWNYATLIFSANDLPTVSITARPNETDAFYNRWILIETPFHFVANPADGTNEKQEDSLLGKKLVEQIELDWFTTWAIEGLIRLLKTERYVESAGTIDVKTRWINKTDSLAAFVDSNVVNYAAGQFTDAKAFMIRYTSWCEEHNMLPEDSKKVSARLPRLIATEKRLKGRRNEQEPVWWNVMLEGATPRTIELEELESESGLQEPIDDESQSRLL